MRSLAAFVAQGRGRLWWVALLAALLGACASGPRSIAPEALLDDARFHPPAQAIDTEQVFALSDAMRDFARRHLDLASPWRDRRKMLIDSLYSEQGLRLGYDTQSTRTASEAFDQRAGNCLSLVIMTAAFARHLELPVRFQSVSIDDEYTRSGDLFMQNGHVNIVLGRSAMLRDPRDASWMTIDFLPPEQLRGHRSTPIEEATVVAMFMNNRAAEALAAGRHAEAYWWAREGLLRDPEFVPVANTLGVIYTRAGQHDLAERALRFVLERDRDNVSALTNLVRLLRADERHAEAEPLAARLTALQPVPPFWYLDRAREAHARGEHREARDLLRRELRRQPFQHEVHFHMALTLAALGDADGAARHLVQARDNSPTRGMQALYRSKLDRLRATRLQ